MSEFLYMVRRVPSVFNKEWRVFTEWYSYELEHKPLVFKTRRQAEAVRKAKQRAETAKAVDGHP